MTQPAVLTSIRDLLDSKSISYREVHHEPTYTSEDAARARGEELRIGGKALVMKADGEHHLFVLPADRRVDSSSIRQTLKLRKLRFASREELAELTKSDDAAGLVPGSVPPFGHPILPFDLYVDSAIRQNRRIAFNAGSLTDSIILNMDDYLAVAAPKRIFGFSEAAQPDS